MVMRIGGLASGMDIDGLVEKLMQAEKAPLNKLYQNKQKYEWQRDAYRDVNKELKAFDEYIQKNMMYRRDFAKKNVVSTNNAVSATAISAQNGQTLNIDKVSQLAKAGNTSGGSGVIPAGTDGNTKLSELGIQPGTVKMSVLQTDGKLKEVDLTFTNDDTINSVISKLKDGTGLNAFYDTNSGQISISTRATGAGENVLLGKLEDNSSEDTIVNGSASVIIESGANFFNSLGFSTATLYDENGMETIDNGRRSLISNGQNAKVTINGLEIERQSNTFEVDGFNVTLNSTYNRNPIEGEEALPITLTTKTDTDNMMDKIKQFVDTYNGLIESLTSKTKEKKFRDFPPLTDEQKKDMEEKEIELWEEKAKSGLLRSDSIVQSALSKMRADMYSKGSGSNTEFDMLFKIGITTSDKTSDNGKLVIKDEEKLRAAIEKDPDAVFELFSGTLDNPGIADKLQKSIKNVTVDIEKKAGKADSVNNTFNLGRSLNDVEDRITNWKRKLEGIEQRYWKQFTAMETAINKANQQSSMFFAGQTQ